MAASEDETWRAAGFILTPLAVGWADDVAPGAMMMVSLVDRVPWTGRRAEDRSVGWDGCEM